MKPGLFVKMMPNSGIPLRHLHLKSFIINAIVRFESDLNTLI